MPDLKNEDISELNDLLRVDGNRGQFYWRYYEMTGEYQALIQAQITTYSGVWGGLAVTGNYFAKLVDQQNYHLTLDAFSFQIANGLLLELEDGDLCPSPRKVHFVDRNTLKSIT